MGLPKKMKLSRWPFLLSWCVVISILCTPSPSNCLEDEDSMPTTTDPSWQSNSNINNKTQQSHDSNIASSDKHPGTSSQPSTISTTKITTAAPAPSTPDNFRDVPSNVISKKDLKQLSSIIKMDNNSLTRLKTLSNKINQLIATVDENHGHFRPEILIQEFIPDPVMIKDILVEKDDWISSYSGKFSNATMYGIGNIQIDSIRANVNKLNAKISMSISHVYLMGNYVLDGSVSLASINGEGPFRFNISEMDIEAFGNLLRDDQGRLQIEDIEIDLSPGDVNLDLENFEVFGSEMIAQTIISTMSELIFAQVKSTVTKKVATKIRFLINDRLAKVSLNNLIQPQSEVLFDDIVATVAKRIKHRVDPVSLPPFQRQIQTKLLQMIPINISVNVEQGKLYGLTTFARMGDIFVTYQDESALIEAEAGFHNLTGKYLWKMDVMGHGPSGSASLAIKKVTSYLRLLQPLKRGAQPRLQEFIVKEIDYVWIEMKGLGIWDHLLELIINSISNVFRLEIGNLITTTVSRVLQKSIDRVKFSFIP